MILGFDALFHAMVPEKIKLIVEEKHRGKKHESKIPLAQPQMDLLDHQNIFDHFRYSNYLSVAFVHHRY